MKRNNQGGFGIVESIIILVIAVAIVFAAYYLGWGARGEAGEQALQRDSKMVEEAIAAYILKSGGKFPTVGGKRPTVEEPVLIMWDASFTDGSKTYTFHPDFIKRLPRHWNEGIWRVDGVARVSVDINPKEY